MTVDAWLTLALVVVTVAVLASERLSPPFAVFGAVTVLLGAGVIDVEEAFSGFSNPAPITVAALYVLAAAAEKTGVLEGISARLMIGRSPGASERRLLTRILVPTAVSSGFVNNTPIVAMAAPAVLSWSRRTGEPPSRFLMPISFAAILGGLLTLIGTSTNLVVSGLLEQSGRAPLGLFEISRVGVPVALAGVALLIVITPWLLPIRKPAIELTAADAREFTVEMIVVSGSMLAGRSIREANLRNLQGVFLVEVERDGRRIAPVSPDEVLVEGDRLTFAGNVEQVLDLQRMAGLVSAEERHFSIGGSALRRKLFEVVVAEGSSLAGATLKEVGFRSKYGAAVLAIHRAGGRVQAKLGEVDLRPGDVLLVLADPGFRRRSLERRDFLVIAPLSGETPPRREKAPIVALVGAALLVLAGTGALDIVVAALLAAFALVALRVLTPAEARDAVDLNVVILIAASFGLGAAIFSSGLAERIAHGVTGLAGDSTDVGLLAGVLLTTLLLTELITNNAAAVLMFPIAVAVATEASLDPRPFAIAVAVGASASFLTPIGYQTNTMVYGIGGYHFGDFARLGLPLTILVLIVSLLVIPLAWPLR